MFIREKQKIIQYTCNYVYYHVQLNPSKILVRIQDFQAKKMYSAFIEEKNVSMKQFSQHVYKQHLYELNREKKMISFAGKNITFHFNFPNTYLKSLSFQCNENTKSKFVQDIQMINQHSRMKANDIKILIQQTQKRLSLIIEQKVSEAIRMVDDKIKSVLLAIDSQIDSKVMMLHQFYSYKKSSQEEEYQKYLAQSAQKIFEDNYKYFNQFDKIRIGIQKNIETLNENLKDQYLKINELEQQLEYYKDLLDEKILKLSINHQQLQQLKSQINTSFKCVNYQLQKIVKIHLYKKLGQPPIKAGHEEVVLLEMQENSIIAHLCDQKVDIEAPFNYGQGLYYYYSY